MLRALTLIVLALSVSACTGFGAVVPGPAPDPGMTGFEARAAMDGYAEYVALAGPNLPLTPTYKVHGKATAVATTIVPYLTIYLEGDAWVEPTPAGDAAISTGEVVIYRAGRKVQSGWQRQDVPGASMPPSGRKTYYASPPTATPCAAPVSRAMPSKAVPCNRTTTVAKAYVSRKVYTSGCVST